MGSLTTIGRRLALAFALTAVLASGAAAQDQATGQPGAAAPAVAPQGGGAVQPQPQPQPQPNDQKPQAAYTQFTGTIVSIGKKVEGVGKDGKKAWVDPKAANFDGLTFKPDGYPAFFLPVTTQEARDTLKVGARPNDRIVIEVDDPTNPTKIVRIAQLTRPVDHGKVLWAVLWVALALAVAIFVATGGDPINFLVGRDGRLSNSQCQMAVWFGVVAIAYGAALILRVQMLGAAFIGGIGLTNHVLLLTGLSGLTFGGAKIISTQKQDTAAAKAKAEAEAAAEKAKAASQTAQITSTTASILPATDPVTLTAQVNAQKDANVAAEAVRIAEDAKQKAAQTPDAAEAPRGRDKGVKPRLSDLFTNGDGEADLGDFQMILISVVSAGIFAFASLDYLSALAVVKEMTLPDVDPALLTAFGLGQGTYLVKKAALPLDKG